MNVFGYARVSTKEQNEDRQLIAFKEYNVPPNNIYIDKQSGKDFNRPQYNKMIRKMKQGDKLYIISIDRLGRNYVEIQNQWRKLTQGKKVDICVINMPLLDTSLQKDLLGNFISDLVLQLLSFVAENERNNIRERQAEGIMAAKARGVRFGRPSKPLPDNFDTVYTLWVTHQISGYAAAIQCGMPVSTFRYKAKKYKH